LMNCQFHGVVLHRCKTKCYASGGKESRHSTNYSEKCFHCINEGRYAAKKEEHKKQSHISMR
jgi:hypothetical protein